MIKHFELKKLVGLPPQLELLAVVSRKLGHDNMSEHNATTYTAWPHRHRQTVHAFSFI